MIITSQNLANHEMNLPPDAIFRVNMAWCDSISEFENILTRHENNQFFVDLPIKRVKPPNNKYTIEDLIPIIKSHNNIRYFAISNVNSSQDLKNFIDSIPKHVSLVPKIESPEGVLHIKEITDILGDEKIIMLDHDDLFSNLVKKNESPDKFKNYIINFTN